MVLADDDFSTLRAAIEEGRRVYDNLVKALAFVLPTSVGQALIIAVAVLAFPAGGGAPVLPGRAGADPLDQPDRRRRARASAGLRGARARPDGAARRATAARRCWTARCWCARSWCRSRSPRSRSGCSRSLAHEGLTVAAAQTTAVTGAVLLQALYLIACRSLTRPNRELGPLEQSRPSTPASGSSWCFRRCSSSRPSCRASSAPPPSELASSCGRRRLRRRSCPSRGSRSAGGCAAPLRSGREAELVARSPCGFPPLGLRRSAVVGPRPRHDAVAMLNERIEPPGHGRRVRPDALRPARRRLARGRTQRLDCRGERYRGAVLNADDMLVLRELTAIQECAHERLQRRNAWLERAAARSAHERTRPLAPPASGARVRALRRDP